MATIPPVITAVALADKQAAKDFISQAIDDAVQDTEATEVVIEVTVQGANYAGTLSVPADS
jgi:hypothetical protein